MKTSFEKWYDSKECDVLRGEIEALFHRSCIPIIFDYLQTAYIAGGKSVGSGLKRKLKKKKGKLTAVDIDRVINRKYWELLNK